MCKFYIKASKTSFRICNVPIKRDDLITLYDRTNGNTIRGIIVGLDPKNNYLVVHDDVNNLVFHYDAALMQVEDFEVVKT